MAVELDNPTAVRRAAMDLLARREHGRVELTRKLRRRGAPDRLIEAALDRLSEEGLLSESRYLEAFIASRARNGYGPLRIREELHQRGLAREAVDQALRTADIDWFNHLQALWQRRFAGCLPENAKQRAQQGRFLAYRGYPTDLIGRLWLGRGGE